MNRPTQRATDETLDADGPAPRWSYPSDGDPRVSDLYGTIDEELASNDSGFSLGNVRLLRYHGVFQQDDRDVRNGVERQYRFMLRLRATGGKFTARQLVGLLDLSESHGENGLHITSRQGLQLSGIRKRELRAVMRGIADLGLTTLATGGHFGCNIMCCPAPDARDAVSAALHATADAIDASLSPRVDAYDAIWLGAGETTMGPDGLRRVDRPSGPALSRRPSTPAEPAPNGSPENARTLPQKFKIGLATVFDNCTEIHAQDLGLLAAVEDGRIVGYNVLIGGSMRNTFSIASRGSSLGSPVAFIDVDRAVDVVRAVIGIFGEFGNREDQTRGRFKYLVQDWGLDRLRGAIEDRIGPLEPPRALEIVGHNDHLGWHEQGEGRWFLGLLVHNGRFDNNASDDSPRDTGPLRDGRFDPSRAARWKDAARRIAGRLAGEFRFTPQRNVLLCGIDARDRDEVDAIVEECGIPAADRLSYLRRHSESCPGLPQCPAAITESERRLPSLLDELERELEQRGLNDERIAVRMTGCPFGCTRCYLADIAIVGRTVEREPRQDKYAIFLGGGDLGQRLAMLYRDLVPADEIIATLAPLLTAFREQRREGESLADFFVRMEP